MVARTEGGSVFHDRESDEWLVDFTAKGITLTLDRGEFLELLQLMVDAGIEAHASPISESGTVQVMPARSMTFVVPSRAQLKAS